MKTIFYITGEKGSGKRTLAKKIKNSTIIALIELDEIHNLIRKTNVENFVFISEHFSEHQQNFLKGTAKHHKIMFFSIELNNLSSLS